jgi:6-methylsalicylate decarboxylase
MTLESMLLPGAEERDTAADLFRRLYLDTALAWCSPVLQRLRSVAGADQVLFGTDCHIFAKIWQSIPGSV